MRLALALVLLFAAPAGAQDRVCRAIECGGHGACFAERGVPFCLCEPGYASLGVGCVRGADELGALRARHDPRAGERVVAIAETQVGRTRSEVGADLEREPFELRRYLMDDEWWCGDFVAWAYEAAGVGFTSGASGGWLVSNNLALRAWFEQRGLWVGRGSAEWSTHEPRPGDYVRFDTERGGHAGIVHHVSGDTLYTIEGNVGARVEQGRYFHFRHNRLIDGFGTLALENEAPVASAGDDPRVAWPGAIELAGTATDDGPFERLDVSWSRVSGPGEVRCERVAQLEARCTVTEPGVHIFELRVSDGALTAEDRVSVEARENRAPIVHARVVERDPHEGVALLEGSAEDDGPLTLRWAHVRGPAPAAFDDAGAARTRVRFPAPGAYVLRFSADDGELAESYELPVEVPALASASCAAAPGATGPWWLLALAAIAMRRLARRARTSASRAGSSKR